MVHGGAQYQIKYVNASLGIGGYTIVDAAVLVLKGLIYRPDISLAIDKQARRHEAKDVELASVLGFYLQTELNRLNGKSLIGDILNRFLLQAFQGFVEDVVILERFHCPRGQQGQAQRLLVEVQDIHRAGAKGTEHRREGEDDNFIYPGIWPVGAAVGRPGTAESKQDEIAGLVAPEERLLGNGITHISIYYFLNQQRGLFYLKPEGAGNLFPYGRYRLSFIQPHASAMIVVRVDITQHDVGIGNGGLGPPEVIRGRPRYGPGTLRPDLQSITHDGVQPGDGASTGSDRPCLQDSHVHPPAVDEGVVLVEPAAAGHYQAQVEACAAHIADHNVVIAQRLADIGPADEAGHRSPVKSLDSSRTKDLGHTAAVMHHHNDLIVTRVPQFITRTGDLLPHGVMKVGI
ncbi:hypothetical protein ES703_39942 [subsurface metagenome]